MEAEKGDLLLGRYEGHNAGPIAPNVQVHKIPNTLNHT